MLPLLRRTSLLLANAVDKALPAERRFRALITVGGEGRGDDAAAATGSDQSKLLYEFRLEDRIPTKHLLRRIDVMVTAALGDLRKLLRSKNAPVTHLN